MAAQGGRQPGSGASQQRRSNPEVEQLLQEAGNTLRAIPGAGEEREALPSSSAKQQCSRCVSRGHTALWKQVGKQEFDVHVVPAMTVCHSAAYCHGKLCLHSRSLTASGRAGGDGTPCQQQQRRRL